MSTNTSITEGSLSGTSAEAEALQQSFLDSIPPSKPTIRHFISRGAGRLVPVIPVDELPINLQDVPLQMTWRQTRDMVFIGEFKVPEETFKIQQGQMSETKDVIVDAKEALESEGDAAISPFSMAMFQMAWENACHEAEREADHTVDHGEDFPAIARSLSSSATMAFEELIPWPELESAVVTPPGGHDPETPILSSPQSSRSRLEDRPPNQPPIEAVAVGPVTTTIRPLPPSGVEPNESMKEYCTYWIRTGECAYTQQGCKYKHEMPPDRATLKKVFGTDKWPAWWVERRHELRLSLGTGSPGDDSSARESRPVDIQRRSQGNDLMTQRSWRPDMAKSRSAVSPRAAYVAQSTAIAGRMIGRSGPSAYARSSSPKRHPADVLRSSYRDNDRLKKSRTYQDRQTARQGTSSGSRNPPARATSTPGATLDFLRDPFSDTPGQRHGRTHSILTDRTIDLIDLADYAALKPANSTTKDEASSGLNGSKWAKSQIVHPKLFESDGITDARVKDKDSTDVSDSQSEGEAESSQQEAKSAGEKSKTKKRSSHWYVKSKGRGTTGKSKEKK